MQLNHLKGVGRGRIGMNLIIEFEVIVAGLQLNSN